MVWKYLRTWFQKQFSKKVNSYDQRKNNHVSVSYNGNQHLQNSCRMFTGCSAHTVNNVLNCRRSTAGSKEQILKD
jgi:hypothetical protein